MDFVGNSYNGYLVTDQKMDGDTLLIKVDGVDGWFNCHDLLSNKLGKVKKTHINMGKVIDTKYGEMTIKESLENNRVVVEFENGFTTTSTLYNALAGDVKNLMYPNVCGIGFIGDGLYNVTNSPKGYSAWAGMLKRAVDSGTTKISEDWCNFQNFNVWYIDEMDKRNKLDKKFVVEKDIISSEEQKIYSADTSLIVPSEINNLFKSTKENKKLPLPVGVTLLGKGQFKVQIAYKRYSRNLGTFNNPIDAEKAYWKAKAEIWKEAAEEFRDYLCDRGFNAIMERVKLHS